MYEAVYSTNRKTVVTCKERAKIIRLSKERKQLQYGNRWSLDQRELMHDILAAAARKLTLNNRVILILGKLKYFIFPPKAMS